MADHPIQAVRVAAIDASCSTATTTPTLRARYAIAFGPRTRGQSELVRRFRGMDTESTSSGSRASTSPSTREPPSETATHPEADNANRDMATGDLAVNVILPKPWDWPEFYSYAHNNFVLRDDSWNPAGGRSRNGSLPYGKR